MVAKDGKTKKTTAWDLASPIGLTIDLTMDGLCPFLSIGTGSVALLDLAPSFMQPKNHTVQKITLSKKSHCPKTFDIDRILVISQAKLNDSTGIVRPKGFILLELLDRHHNQSESYRDQ
jgi:hypothetical protein